MKAGRQRGREDHHILGITSINYAESIQKNKIINKK